MILAIRNHKDRFQIANIYCIGRNYPAHAQELGNELPTEPVVFIKSKSCLTQSRVFILPKTDSNVHYEGELVVAIKYDCGRIDETLTEHVILGYAVGIDYTERTIQTYCKGKGLPWTMSKNFYGSAPISDITLKKDTDLLMDRKIHLTVNDKVCQEEYLNQMTFSIPYLISYLSHHFPLMEGDLIFTGTPKGVAKIRGGDRIKCWIDGVGEVYSTIEQGQ
ncbi:MAG: fumarylacetoacetase [bacterium]|nr:MAG: fumarylacetoacetase [bacterium]